MQYVRSISGSVSKTWNSINPATLSGAIDVIVVEHEDGTLACSPFHVRFGKFSLLRPFEKKVEFRVNGVKQDFSMKLGEGGEAFFVFETTDDVPIALQTSPLVSPAGSPKQEGDLGGDSTSLQEPDVLDLNKASSLKADTKSLPGMPIRSSDNLMNTDLGLITPLSRSPSDSALEPHRLEYGESARLDHSVSEALLPENLDDLELRPEYPTHNAMLNPALDRADAAMNRRSLSPPHLSPTQAVSRAIALSRKLSGSNIPSHVTETGDLMLDMTGYKSSEEDALRAEVIARKILAEELEGNYDIGSLIGADEHGNLWIYSSEEAKETASRRSVINSLKTGDVITGDTVSDPGYHSDSEQSISGSLPLASRQRTQSDVQLGFLTPPQSPMHNTAPATEPNRNYAKTLRLTSDQLKSLNLKPGVNPITFSVNRATCPAFMYLWGYKTPIVISDIDGTITKSDALGHVLNMIGRDWTHQGVAKLFTDIASNGYHIMYLTSRSTGQADTTRAYLNGILQDGYKIPKGPVIMSPDRTIAALRREIYLRKPEVFKMACLRDILSLFPPNHNPFYAGFGNRLTDALSYRSVNIPSARIFTINSNAEVSLDLLSLNKYRSSYVSMRELVDHFFPPVGLLVQVGGEEFTDFTYWRDQPPNLEDFSVTDSEDGGIAESDRGYSDDEGSALDDEEDGENLADSYISRGSIDDRSFDESLAERMNNSRLSESDISEGLLEIESL